LDLLQLPFSAPNPYYNFLIHIAQGHYSMTHNFREKANFIWQVADDTLRVRGAFKAHEYRDVILPFVVLRRLDRALKPQKDIVIKW
jgi:hypothetical protein